MHTVHHLALKFFKGFFTVNAFTNSFRKFYYVSQLVRKSLFASGSCDTAPPFEGGGGGMTKIRVPK